MLSVPNVWLRPNNQRKEADQAKALLTIPDGDHLTLLNVYNSWMQNLEETSWSWNNYVSQRALMQAKNVRRQLESTMVRSEIPLVTVGEGPKLYQRVREALVCGFFMQVAHKEDKVYITIKDNQQVTLHPSCGLDTQPEWVLFNEFVLTTRPYVRTVSTVNPEWLLQVAANYYDIDSWKDGEAKRSLSRVREKLLGRRIDGPPPKKKPRA